jgi:uroporphyrin-3 C-methyltransferase
MNDAKLPPAPLPPEAVLAAGMTTASTQVAGDTAPTDAAVPPVAPPLRSTAPVAGPAQPAGGGWFATTMLMVALLALVLSGLLWQRLDRIQQELAKRSADVAEETEKSRDSADQALELVQELQARVSVAEVKLSEVSLQRTQLEELMLSVSRSRDDTLVLDIESGVRLAMQQAELTGSAQPLLSALQAADRRIAKAAQPRLNPVQRAMARDMDRIKASPVADLPLLASRLDELARAVDEWPLLNAEPKKRMPSLAAKANKDSGQSVVLVVPSAKASSLPSAAPGASVTEPAKADGAADVTPKGDEKAATGDQPVETEVAPPAPEPKPTVAASTHKKSPHDKAAKPAAPAAAPPETTASSLLHTVQTTWASWWGRFTEHVSTATRDLVRVSRIDEPDAVLLSPEQAVFLRENLKLRLLNARLSLLSRQVSASRADMQAVKTAMTKYFDPQSPVNRQAQQALGEVLQASRSLELPRPDDTLAALAKAAGGR